jgi:hypothetical protein
LATLEERQALRREILDLLYERTGGDPSKRVPLPDVTPPGNSEEERRAAARLLKDEGVIDFATDPRGELIGPLSIKHAGVVRAERERGIPVVRVSDTDGSSQAAGSALLVLSPAEQGELERLLGELRQAVEEASSQLRPDDAVELEVDLASAEAQLRSPRPKRGIVRAALEAVQEKWSGLATGVVIGVTANAAFAAIAGFVGKL